jgi:hypothetical protein
MAQHYFPLLFALPLLHGLVAVSPVAAQQRTTVGWSADLPAPIVWQVEEAQKPANPATGGDRSPADRSPTGPSPQEAGVSGSADDLEWLSKTRVGYDGGFVIASTEPVDLKADEASFELKINGWGQLRHTVQDLDNGGFDLNQFQLKRGRIVFAGHAFNPDFFYFVQIDGRSSSGDDVRLLDYYLSWDIGRHRWGLDRDVIGFRTGKYKMPFNLARDLSGREFEFTDRSMASMYFDVNRSFAWGLYGKLNPRGRPLNWETAIFNGLVTGGAETGSAGTLDNNFAWSMRLEAFPSGEWGKGSLADFDGHCRLATRVGLGVASSLIDRRGTTEFQSVRVVDSGERLSNLLPASVREYAVDLYSVDASLKYLGWSATLEYYFRNIGSFEGADLPDLYDHGFWLQCGKFVVPGKLQVLARWSRVVGNSGTLGVDRQSADEVAGGLAWYFRDQSAKLVVDATDLNGAPINSSALDMAPGDSGWLYRTQIQFAF